jgi:hypothetical protein
VKLDAKTSSGDCGSAESRRAEILGKDVLQRQEFLSSSCCCCAAELRAKSSGEVRHEFRQRLLQGKLHNLELTLKLRLWDELFWRAGRCGGEQPPPLRKCAAVEHGSPPQRGVWRKPSEAHYSYSLSYDNCLPDRDVCVENRCEHTPQQTACVFVGVEIYFIGGVNPASQSSFAKAKLDA